MNYVFANPDKVMVGCAASRQPTLLAPGARRSTTRDRQVREATTAALAEWLAQVITEMGRPASPDDLSLEAEYETDFVAGDIAVSLDEEAHTIEVTFESLEGEDELVLTLTREWAGGLAIPSRDWWRPVDRRVALRRSARSQGHDCPRTNGHTPRSVER